MLTDVRNVAARTVGESCWVVPASSVQDIFGVFWDYESELCSSCVAGSWLRVATRAGVFWIQGTCGIPRCLWGVSVALMHSFSWENGCDMRFWSNLWFYVKNWGRFVTFCCSVYLPALSLSSELGFYPAALIVLAMLDITVKAAGLTVERWLAALDAKSERYVCGTAFRLNLCALFFVNFTADSLGCARFLSFLFGEFLTHLFDVLFIDRRTGCGAFHPALVFRVLAVPCAVLLGAGGATGLLMYRWLAAAA